jgi:hypothetical protein
MRVDDLGFEYLEGQNIYLFSRKGQTGYGAHFICIGIYFGQD